MPSLSIDQEPITSRRAILCEGSGDRNLLQELIKDRGLPDFYVTHPREEGKPGGRQGFESRLRSLKLQPNFGDLTGIAVFSDDDRQRGASFTEVRGQLHDAGFKVPNEELKFVVGPPAIAIVMIPIGEPGQLETLCLRAISDEWADQFKCAEKYAECAGVSGWAEGKREKASLRALISHICKNDPNTSQEGAPDSVGG